MSSHESVEIVRRLGSPRILVAGDAMLDHFIWGGVRRVAPEAPTPVLAFEDETFQLGGAAFTASVLAQLGAQVDLACVIGQDEWGGRLAAQLEALGIRPIFFRDASRPTTRKQRLCARDSDLPSGRQQLLRVDFESSASLSAEVEAEVISGLSSRFGDYDAIVASDYGKGFLTPSLLRSFATQTGRIPVIGDPRKGADLSLYQGFTALKPNRTEAELQLGRRVKNLDDAAEAARLVIAKAGLEWTFVSLDAEGLFWAHRDGRTEHVPTRPRQVYDVAGAGDSVVSCMAMFSAGNPPRQLMEIANAAAGIMISQQSPKTISRADIVHQLVIGEESGQRKIRTPSELRAILDAARSRGRQVYFTNGHFDRLSTEQIQFLERLGGFDGVRVVGVNSDRSLRAAGKTPLLHEDDRLRLLQMFDCVDYIVLFDEERADSLLRAIRPQVFLKGANYRGRDILEAPTLAELGCVVQYVDLD